MNRELQATFDLKAFEHEAFYNPMESRIEIYLRSLGRQSVAVAGRTFDFAKGERVHTEYSYKYDTLGIEILARAGSLGGRDLDRSGRTVRRRLLDGILAQASSVSGSAGTAMHGNIRSLAPRGR